jgi:hypothetical protein
MLITVTGFLFFAAPVHASRSFHRQNRGRLSLKEIGQLADGIDHHAVGIAILTEPFQCDLETLKTRGIRGNLARRCAITLCWDHAGLSHHEIAALFGMAQQQCGSPDDSGNEDHDAQTPKVLEDQISHK